ncbi:sensor histidine kinase [Gottfriedia acidiceleris]|uniref:histidine kinase n=1 Tax=Gottfriedia acidiceleris TaxID=371036 RepID=A0ABY4JI72_9BACI|nr:HAMP domain-containing sensor histidine kinase [Gottfriedia acidiceleris]UPM52538.1 HAMP domain-containing histidine kinase [Gottfriedia acidiceleris]
MSFYIYLDQKSDLITVLKEEIKEVKMNAASLGPNVDNTPRKHKRKNVYFNYFLNKNNGFEIYDETSPGYTKDIEKVLKQINPNQNKVVIKRIAPHDKEELNLMIAAEEVYDSSNHYLGTIYSGKDLSSVIYLIKQFISISFLLSIIFCFMAYYFGKKITNQAMEPIIASYKEQQEFVENASHELRTPLSVLQAGIDVLSVEQDRLSDFGKETLSDLKKELSDTRNLVHQLLFLARLDHKQIAKVNIEEFRIDVFSEQIQKAWQYKASEKKQIIQLLNEEKFIVKTNQESLKQLINIFVDNAIKYSNENCSISLNYYVRSEKKANYFYYEINDKGIGIAKELQEKIFNRFYRIEEHRSRDEGNTGLGLSIAKSIIESLNGEIIVNSEVGKGSSFKIKIPISNLFQIKTNI